MVTALFFLLAIVGTWKVYQWLHSKEISDAKALFWSRVAEPILVMSEHPFDEGVLDRAEEYRNLLVEHGNKLLDPSADVWVRVHSAELDFSRDFLSWREQALRIFLADLAEWRKQKFENANDQAMEFLAFQKRMFTDFNDLKDGQPGASTTKNN